MKKYKFEAVIFDLDGVITKTALVHSAAWKKMFDEYLQQRVDKLGEEFNEFSHENDYLPYVDGKPRYKGVESFLKSRGIELPFGDPSDEPGQETVCGLGNRKNQAFNDVLDKDGVEVYESTVALMKELLEKGFKVGVASSSKNCKAVLEKAGLIHMIETRVDGVVSAEIGLQGKPEPDIFTTAADNLNVDYDKAVVVEDAVSGVQAGQKGNFGLTLGIARENNTKELKINGADIVVEDISEIGFKGINEWFEKDLDNDNWKISYDDYFPEKEKTRETLLTIGNGYFGTRGAMEGAVAGEFNYPGTYVAGLYNRLTSMVGDREIENEDFVNIPNWLFVNIKIEDEPWIDLNDCEIISIHRELDFRTGALKREAVIRDHSNRELLIESERFASMDNPHLAVLEYYVTPVNFSANITLKTWIDGDIINDGVARYRQLNQKHLEPVKEKVDGSNLQIVVKTTQSDIHIAVSSRIDFYKNSEVVYTGIRNEASSGKAMALFSNHVEKDQSIGFAKTVSIYTSQTWDSKDPDADAEKSMSSNLNVDDLLKESAEVWKKIWDKIDVKICGDRLAQKLLRLHMYHLMASMSPHNKSIDASITARGLHGEAYRGHIFWDELFILPFYNMHFPEVTKSALMYRYRRLEEARKYAKENGFRGAMFPWQSGSDGKEETQVVHLNPVSGKWGPDFSSLQRHVSLAIGYNIWQYYHSTGDQDFLEDYGAEMLFEICRFWASKAELNKETNRYSIKNVMGPDEFHEKYPGSDEGGLKDNTYTNLMVVWLMRKALAAQSILSENKYYGLCDKIRLGNGELTTWEDIAAKMNLVVEEDILSQYDGYFDLEELDWDHYREKYGNVYRMDRLLKAEGKSADDYKVAKQADTLQTFYNLDEEEVTGMLQGLGYQLSEDYLKKNLEYYLRRTSHGSTLSRVVHAQLANMIQEKELSWELYKDALTSDFNDIQGGTTGEGIHAGVMAGTVSIAIQSFAGIDLRGDTVKIDPQLPLKWRNVAFGFDFKDVRYQVAIGHEEIIIMTDSDQHMEVAVKGKKVIIPPGKEVVI